MKNMDKFVFLMKLKGYNVFEGDFGDEQDVIGAFEIDEKELQGAFILYASYDCEGYEGSAFVLFERAGQLYEVHGGHCSCMGLEDQWDPEETTVDALVHCIKNGRLGKGYMDADVFGQKLLDMLVAEA